MPATGDRDESGRVRSEAKIVASDRDGFAGDAVWCPSMQVCWQTIWEDMNGGEPVRLPWLTGTEEMSMRAMAEHPYEADRFVRGRLGSYAGPREGLGEAMPEASDANASAADSRGDGEGTVLYATLRPAFTFYEGFTLRDGSSEQEGEWTFGAEWHGNVARHVTYAYAGTTGQFDQVFPLLYDDYDRNAVAVGTMDGDLVVLAQGLSGMTVAELWSDLAESAAAGGVDKVLDEERDSFEFPALAISATREFPEWILGEFETDAGEHGTIGHATQAIDMVVDAEGGRPGCDSDDGTTPGDSDELPTTGQGDAEGRRFAYTDDFVMFLVDGKACGCHESLDYPVDISNAYPYLAVSVHDITAFQEGAERLVDYDPMWGVDIDTGDTVVRSMADLAEDASIDRDRPADE